MTCPVCGDKGVMRVRYHDDSPDAFGLCRCEVGLRLRSDKNAVGRSTGMPLWWVWAAEHQVNHAQVFNVEELLSDEELARIPAVSSAPQTQQLADTMRTKRPRL